jgi:hypothetical protein
MRTFDNFGREIFGAEFEEHVQSTPVSSVTIEHNRGRKVFAKVFDYATGEELVAPDIDQSDDQQMIVSFTKSRRFTVLYH